MGTHPALDTELRYVADDATSVETTVSSVDQQQLSRALPVREPISYRGQRNYSGLFWSATTGAHVLYESLLELDRLSIVDFDPDVMWIAAQPMWVQGCDGDRRHRHVPDFLLTQGAGLFTVLDVKSETFVSQPEVAAVFAWTGQACAALGWRYDVWTGGDPLVLANIRARSTARRLAKFTDLSVVSHLSHGDLLGIALALIAAVSWGRTSC